MGLEDKSQRIVDAAIELAEEGGFEGVRLRDVAARSGLALGTLYARFASKEDILMAALDEEVQSFRNLLLAQPIQGADPAERILRFFNTLSSNFLSRPNFARAVLRSVVSGVPVISEKVLQFQEQLIHMAVMTLNGDGQLPEQSDPQDPVMELAFYIEQIWFASLVGWMSGSMTEEMIAPHLKRAVTLLINGQKMGPLA